MSHHGGHHEHGGGVSTDVYAGGTLAVVHVATWVLVASALFLAQRINLISLANLAAILLFTSSKLASPQLFTQQWVQGHFPMLPFMITLIRILWLDMLEGIVSQL